MGSPAQDTTVFSRVLYQLSYLAPAAESSGVDQASRTAWARATTGSWALQGKSIQRSVRFQT